MKIKKIREQIGSIDTQILDLLSERRHLSANAIDAKARDEVPLRDQEREQAVLSDLVSKGHQLGLDAQYVMGLFQHVIEDSIRVQQQHLQKPLSTASQTDTLRIAFSRLRLFIRTFSCQTALSEIKTSDFNRWFQ